MKSFKKNSTRTIASTIETKLKITVSPMNCEKSPPLPLPKTFFTPISLALFVELAVARFMKFIHAKMSTIMAMVESIYTY